jgi:ectoine hydroxylase-related dioxygenase (phytanoyl-CoA dioxygenase family)
MRKLGERGHTRPPGERERRLPLERDGLPRTDKLSLVAHPRPTMASRTVKLGDATFAFPSEELQPLVDSKALLDAGDIEGLRARLASDGYLCLRGLIPRELVLAARRTVLDDLTAKGNVLVAGKEAEGVLVERCMAGCVPFMEGKNALTHSPEMLSVLAGEHLRAAMEALLGGEAVTFDFKWLRAAWNSFFTGIHLDRVYMGRGSASVLTTWVPLDDATLELGALAVLEGSNRLPGFARLQETYGNLDVERDNFKGSGWFGTDPREVAALDRGAVWRTGDFSMGDVMVFGMRTLHMSTVNLTDRVRISADVRWQPAADARDDRYFGAVDEKVKERQKAGAWADAAAAAADTRRTIEELKVEWGFGA